MKELSFNELRDNFLSGLYDSDGDAHHNALNELHSKLVSIEDLIPLLKSGNRNCEYTASFISALEGENAKPIFPYLFALLGSPWEEVRDEVCDCFLSCTSDANHYIALFKLLNDSSQAIRLRVITVICGLDNDVINGIYKNLNSFKMDNDLLKGMALLKKQITKGITLNDVKNLAINGSALEKVFAYVATYKEFGQSEILFEISLLTTESDIKKHYEIYFSEEDETE
jgi:hypothetical protein